MIENSNNSDECDRFADVLLTHNHAPSQPLLDALVKTAYAIGFELAGSHLAALLIRLDIRHRALWFKLLGRDDDFDAIADEVGVSSQALGQAHARLRERLKKKPRD